MSKSWAAALATVLVVAVGCGVFFFSRGAPVPAPEEVAFSEVLKAAEAGTIRELRLGERTLRVVLRDGREWRSIPPAGFIAGNPTFIPELARRDVRIEVEQLPEITGYNVVLLGLGALFLGFVGFMVYRIATGRIPALESKARVARADHQVITFKDVAGVDEAKEEVKEIVEFLTEPEKFVAVGGRIPKGVLLVGPPGTGKTLLARSIAGEAGVPFLFASGSDFVEMYAGVGAARIRKLFAEARRHKRCIVFIDELDAVGRQRGSHSISHEEREQTLNQLLVEMDGFEGHTGTVVLAATNRADILDPALLRPGRFDRQVMVGVADIRGREAILRVHAARVTLGDDVDLKAIARGTPGFSGADLANLVNEAALLAARAGRSVVLAVDFEGARDKVLMGVERRSLAMTEAERVNCAYHEAGHAVVAAVVPKADPLHKVTIIPRGRALGVTMQLPEADRHTHTRDYLEAQIAILMGGRVAEELFLGHMTSGAANDIERATDIARRMVCLFGMSRLGPRAFRMGTRETDQKEQLSEHAARRVDEEVDRILAEGYATAQRVLTEYRAGVEALAQKLLEVETLDADGIRIVLEEAMALDEAARAEAGLARAEAS